MAGLTMKINLSDLSILHRVYLGFAVLIGVLMSGSFFSYLNQNELNSALRSVAEEASPIVVSANRLEISLLYTNKRLTDVLTEKEPAKLEQLSKDLDASRLAFSKAIADFKKLASQQAIMAPYVTPLEKAAQKYLQDTDGLAKGKSNVLTQLLETNKAKVEFQTFLPLFKGAIDGMILVTEDSYVQGLFRTMLIKQSTIEVSTLDALNQTRPKPIEMTLTRNRALIEEYKKMISDLKVEEPNLENNAGLYIKSFILNTTDDKGLLARYLKLVKEQGALESKAENANQQVMEVQSELAKVQKVAQDLMNKNIDNANHTLASGQMQLLGTVVLATIFAICVAFQLARSIRVPLRQILNVLGAVTSGDMTTRVSYKNNNEFGRLGSQLNKQVEQMADILRQLAEASKELNNVAHDNHTTAERSRSELDLQRSETASVATAMTEMEATVREVAQAASHTLNQVIVVEKAAETGRSVMATNISTIHQLANKLTQTGKVIGDVSNMSNNIGNILEVIRGIAEQTNLLALNAAIEAARAGEHGRGFAVVADEVRTLARRTADSTSEINKMIDGLQQAVQRAVKEMGECSKEMESSMHQSSNANSSMEEIQAIITQISDMSSQIAAAAEEQQATGAEISANINRISEISDSNYEGIEQVAETSTRLNQLARNQAALVSRFKL